MLCIFTLVTMQVRDWEGEKVDDGGKGSGRGVKIGTCHVLVRT
jgi:hypothetical protein